MAEAGRSVLEYDPRSCEPCVKRQDSYANLNAQSSKMTLGTKVWVLKVSINEWFLGKIIRASEAGAHIEFLHGEVPCRKALPWGSPQMRAVNDKPDSGMQKASSEYDTVVGRSLRMPQNPKPWEQSAPCTFRASPRQIGRIVNGMGSETAWRRTAVTVASLPALDSVDEFATFKACSSWSTGDLPPVASWQHDKELDACDSVSTCRTETSLPSISAYSDEVIDNSSLEENNNEGFIDTNIGRKLDMKALGDSCFAKIGSTSAGGCVEGTITAIDGTFVKVALVRGGKCCTVKIPHTALSS